MTDKCLLSLETHWEEREGGTHSLEAIITFHLLFVKLTKILSSFACRKPRLQLVQAALCDVMELLRFEGVINHY